MMTLDCGRQAGSRGGGVGHVKEKTLLDGWLIKWVNGVLLLTFFVVAVS